MDSSAPPSGGLRTDLARAIICAGDHDTPYVRVGEGPTLVLLLSAGAHPPVRDSLLATLARRFRVILPQLPSCFDPLSEGATVAAAPFAAWLREFLEGLGVTQVILAADERFIGLALEFLDHHGWPVERAVLITVDAADPAGELDRELGGGG